MTSNEILLVPERLADLTLHFRGRSYHLSNYAACSQSKLLDEALSSLEIDDWTSICELTDRCKAPGHRCLQVADNGELSLSSKTTIYQAINPIEPHDFQAFLELIVDPTILLKSVPSWPLTAWRAQLKPGDQVRFAKKGHDDHLAYRAAEVIARRGEFFELRYHSSSHSSGYKTANVHWHLIFQTGCIPPAREERLDSWVKKHGRSFKLALLYQCDLLLMCFEKRVSQILAVELPSPKPRVLEGLWHLIGLIDQLDNDGWPAIKQQVMDALSLDEHPDQRTAYQMVFGSCLTVSTRAKMLSERVTETPRSESKVSVSSQPNSENVQSSVQSTQAMPPHVYQIPAQPAASPSASQSFLNSTRQRFDRLSTIIDIQL